LPLRHFDVKSGLSLDKIMTTQVAAFDAKQKFSELLARANEGETIVITRHGVPMAKLSPIEEPRDFEEAKRKLFERVKNQPTLNLPRVTRDQIYDREDF
jgi:prevent-host-death family protein